MESHFCGYFFHCMTMHMTKAVELHLKRGNDTEMLSILTQKSNVTVGILPLQTTRPRIGIK